MTPKQIHELLDDYAATEIPETLNMMKEINQRIKALPQPIPTPRPQFRLRWAAALSIIVMFIGAFFILSPPKPTPTTPVVNGNGQAFALPDVSHVPEWERPRYQAFVTPPRGAKTLRLTQKSPTDDVNVRVIWARADGNEISVAWEVDYDPQYPPMNIVDSTVTLTQNGQALTRYELLPDLLIPVSPWGDNRMHFYGIYHWDATGLPTDTETLDLTFMLDVQAMDMESDEAKITPYQAYFEFNLAYKAPLFGVTETITMEEKGIALSLRDIRYSDSSVLGVICLPESLRTVYYPVFEVGGEESHLFDLRYDSNLSDDDKLSCANFRLTTKPAVSEQQLTLTISQLRSYVADMSESRFAAFAEAVNAAVGLTVTLDDNGMTYTVQPSEGMNIIPPEIDEEIQALDDELLWDKIEGSWVFEIPLS